MKKFQTTLHDRYHKAAREGFLSLLTDATKSDCNRRDENGMTPVMWAAREGKLSALRMLVSKGGDIEARDHEGCTALHHAAMNGHTECVKFLAYFGAELNATNKLGHTALMLALLNEQPGVHGDSHLLIARFLDDAMVTKGLPTGAALGPSVRGSCRKPQQARTVGTARHHERASTLPKESHTTQHVTFAISMRKRVVQFRDTVRQWTVRLTTRRSRLNASTLNSLLTECNDHANQPHSASPTRTATLSNDQQIAKEDVTQQIMEITDEIEKLCAEYAGVDAAVKTKPRL